ncbi:MAG: hypothetical protein RSE07_00605 [Oscillospiraceae bacterium]
MENKDLIRILKYILFGILVAIGGMFFADIIGDFFNGMDYGSASVLGICMYLCIVVVTCTGIIVHKIDKNASSDKTNDK